jgi:hypothetical protein
VFTRIDAQLEAWATRHIHTPTPMHKTAPRVVDASGRFK